MTRPDATFPAIFKIREDLTAEKDNLLHAMREMSVSYWGGTDPQQDEILIYISTRIEEITTILNRMNTGAYKL